MGRMGRSKSKKLLTPPGKKMDQVITVPDDAPDDAGENVKADDDVDFHCKLICVFVVLFLNDFQYAHKETCNG